ncbi:MAG: beta-propeller domain-containing protein [Nanoarchaeota archaeon]|nr:beta-propeller domain-containing protein [Nanoarchaeota archaeon]
MNLLKSMVKIVFVSVCLLILTGCSSHITNQEVLNNQNQGSFLFQEERLEGINTFESNLEIEQFLLKKILKSSQLSMNFNGMTTSPVMRADMMMESSVDMVASDSSPPPTSSSGTSQIAEDISSTNVQVKGVDEADIVKTNGEYIYSITKNTLSITKAFPPENLEIVYTKELEGNSQNIFIQNNSLIVISNEYEDTQRVSQFQYKLQPTYRPQTRVLVFDISNVQEIEIVDEIVISGWYNQARMIGDFVYIIAQEQAFSYGRIITPFIDSITQMERIMPPVYYFDEDDEEYSYTTIVSLQISDVTINSQREINVQSFLLGASSTVYVSNNNIYLANREHQFRLYTPQIQLELFSTAILPQYPTNIQAEINKYDIQTQWSEISAILVNYYDSLSPEELEELYEKVNQEVSKFETEFLEENMKTTIHSFSIDTKSGVVEYQTSGDVKGYLLNQFSLDEYNSHLRVATTFSIWNRNLGGRVEYNNLYVLNSDLEVVGSVENIAPDERIFSVRFMGERGYIVTFRDVDPLFTLDLSNPQSPQILGELKIDGFSNYLHPFGENHLIGIGRDTEELERGGFRMKGLKLSLFNVEDMTNPIEQDFVVYGAAGSSSAAEYDHKALVFNPTKNLLIIPVSIREENYQEGFQGILVIKVSEEGGFEELARITHRNDENNQIEDSWRWNWWYNSDTTIVRSIYLDEFLYTISNKYIQVHNIDNNFQFENNVDMRYITKDDYRDGREYYYE